jgi:hypothetical protein
VPQVDPVPQIDPLYQVDPVPQVDPLYQVDPLLEDNAQPEPRGETPCCCCDLSIPAITCKMQPDDRCWCTKVLCPPNVPTIWPFGRGGHTA